MGALRDGDMSLLGKALGILTGGGRGLLQAGDLAPRFELRDSDGALVRLEDVLADGPAVLAFYPAAFTAGCTRELRAYTARTGDLVGRGARLLAISTDDVETLARFKRDLGATYTFLSDPGGSVSALYAGVTMGRSNRVTVVVGQDGRITRVTSGVAAIFPDGDIAACPTATGRA